MDELRGTTQECLDRLQIGSVNLGLALAQFCSVSPKTVQGWLSDRRLPKGVKLIQLRAFLELFGYSPNEVAELDPVVLSLNQLIGFSLLSLEELYGKLSYSSNQHMLQILQGNHTMLGVARAKAVSLVKEYESELTAIRRELLEGFAESHEIEIAIALLGVAESEVQRFEDAVDIVGPLTALLQSVLPLATILESSSCSDEDRQRLRESVGEDEFFKLTNLLHRLGGRRAREQYRREITT